MQQNSTNPDSPEPDNIEEQDYPEELKVRAREFFAKASEVAYTLNYDYAIELYLDGLSFWPTTIDEGHKPLRDIAMRRQAAGGKKSGFSDNSKYKKTSGKVPRDAMLKAEYLLSKDPNNQAHMMDMIKAAIKCDYKKIVVWMADILFDSALHQDKPSASTYVFLRDSYVKAEVYTRALHACQLAIKLKPKDPALQDAMRDLSAQSTMQQGRYDDEGDFRDSIKDREKQEKLQSQDQVVRTEDVVRDAITQARKEYEAEPSVPGKISKLVTALCDTDNEEKEKEAIAILEKAHAQLGQFHYKQRSGEIRIKLLTRTVRKLQQQLQKDPSNKELAAKLTEVTQKLLQTELAHYKQCVENFPTDMRLKYEYGKQLVRTKKYDEAIPLFQEARGDPRHRIAALNYIGRCFFHKQWYTDAVETFEQALELVENKESDIAKELLYNLGRSHEENNSVEDALNYYRRVAQVDFNYRDAKNRVDALRQQQSPQKKSED